MFKNLSAGAIGVRGTTAELAALAQKTGFGGMDLNAAQAADLLEGGRLDELERLYEEHDLRPGGFGLPVDFRRDEQTFQQGLGELPRLARAAAAMGCKRCPTWIIPGSDELTFEENFELHRGRLRACAEVLADHGIWLGLEFVGPKTSRARWKHEFIWNMAGMLELADAIGTGNVGLLLDCWHWYTSHGTGEDLRKLTDDDVVDVHINDAPDGVPVDEQIDNIRRLPGETGVIDIVTFLRSLHEIGYTGPVMAEPFRKDLNELPDDEVAKIVAESMEKVWKLADLA